MCNDIVMEKTMVAKVISELKSVSRLKIFSETGHLSFKKNQHYWSSSSVYIAYI